MVKLQIYDQLMEIKMLAFIKMDDKIRKQFQKFCSSKFQNFRTLSFRLLYTSEFRHLHLSFFSLNILSDHVRQSVCLLISFFFYTHLLLSFPFQHCV